MFTNEYVGLGLGFDMKFENRFLGLITFFAVFLTIGCENEYAGEKVNYGPAVTENEVISAVYDHLISGTQPANTKAGAFVHFASTENIAGGTLNILLADTGQTTISREESSTQVTFNIVEKTVAYHPNSPTPEKVTRNFELTFDKPKVASAVVGVNEFIGVQLFRPTSETLGIVATEFARRAAKTAGSIGKAETPTPSPNPSASPAPTAAPANSGTTFHRLKTWTSEGPPPEAVRAQPDCGGVPQCKLRFRHVVFDIVTWDIPGGNLIHMELVASPDVPQTFGLNMNPIFPYLPGLLRSCYTRLVSTSPDGGGLKTLLTDCNDAVNFTFAIGNQTLTSAEDVIASH